MWKNHHAVTYMDTEWQLMKSFKTHNRKLETKQEEKMTGSVSAHLTFTSHFNNTEK